MYLVDVEESVLLCDFLSDIFFEVSFVDVSSVESGCFGRFGYVNVRLDSNVFKIFKKIWWIDVRKVRSFFELEDEIEKL